MKARLFICLFKPKAIYCRCFINQQVSSVMAMYNNIFKITHNDVLPAQGSILISEPFLQDAYFQRSVVLLVEHTQEGSMGFVLNKKTELWCTPGGPVGASGGARFWKKTADREAHALVCLPVESLWKIAPAHHMAALMAAMAPSATAVATCRTCLTRISPAA